VLCRRCRDELTAGPALIEAGPPGVDLAVAAAPFGGPARAIVHGLKYGRRLGLARVAAEAIRAALPAWVSFDAIVPVPAGPWRRRWRGFDPAEEIALALAKLTEAEVRPCLRRTTGRRQVGRRRSERLSDPPRVWAAEVTPLRVLLVDDVWTTGASLSACAEALRDAGAGAVTAVTLARAL
jgi:predicted amidophosphoribosyltransferase